jgi:penicillin-binding protein 2
MHQVFFDEIKAAVPVKRFRAGKRSKNVSVKTSVIGGETVLTSKEKEFVLNRDSKMWSGALFLLLVTGTSLLFIARAFTYQVIEADSYSQLSDRNTVREQMLQPERGVIYDRSGNYLTRNKPAFSVDLATSMCSLGYKEFGYCKSMVSKVGDYIPLDRARIFSELEAGKSDIILATGLTKDQILPLEANIQKYPGVSIVTAPQRDYFYGDAFSHILGYVGIGKTLYPSIEGKMGVEEKYNGNLAGVFGSRTVRVDSLGKPLNVISEKEPVPGKSLTLFIDKELQLRAYELLKEAVEGGDAEAGVVVAQDPMTGGVLALVSYPAFDPNKMSGGISREELNELNSDLRFPFFNRAISAVYPPGSTFKMVVASAVLMENIVGEHYKIFDPGFIQVGSYIFRNWKLDGHGEVDVRRALQVSNDTYFYTVGGGYGGVKGLGIEKLHNWSKKFGFGSKTGIDLPGEAGGFVPDGNYKDWYLGDTYISSIGQGDFLSTPLQTNNMTVYFANGGLLLKPRVVESTEGIGKTPIEILDRDLTDRRTYDTVREGMHLSVIPGGTGYPVFDFPSKHGGIKLAGKTGTSEYISPQGEERTHAWFTVFGPYEKGVYESEIALTVFLEGGGGGSDDAAPIARELLDLWFER